MTPDYIKTVKAPTLDEKAYEKFIYEQNKLQNDVQNVPLDNIYKGRKSYNILKRFSRKVSLKRVCSILDSENKPIKARCIYTCNRKSACLQQYPTTFV